MNIYERLVDTRAKEITEKLFPKIIRDLLAIKIVLSGDDSPLKNTWDEICVQMQDEKFILWEPYQNTIEGVIQSRINELPHYDLCAIWLQTNQGLDYYLEYEEDEITYDQQDIIDYLCHVLLSKAGDWSNPRIREYIESQYNE